MPNLSDAFDWAFRRTLAVFEENPSHPAELPVMVCESEKIDSASPVCVFTVSPSMLVYEEPCKPKVKR